MRMHARMKLSSLQVAAAAILLSLSLSLWLHAAQESPNHEKEEASAHQLVKEMVENEVRSQKGDRSYWRFREIDKSQGTTKAYEVVETEGGLAKALVAINGKPLSAKQKQAQRKRLEQLLKNPATAKLAAQARHHDGEQERKMLELLPQAFVFHYGEPEGNLIRLNFEPNPDFTPPSRRAQVFHHMAGYILIDPHEKRLVEIQGTLQTEVKFMWGLLGYLNKGGTFFVKQENLGGNRWRLSRLRVNMQGRALFFKTIGVQENQWFKDYRANPSGLTLAQAVAELEHTEYYSSKTSSGIR